MDIEKKILSKQSLIGSGLLMECQNEKRHKQIVTLQEDLNLFHASIRRNTWIGHFVSFVLISIGYFSQVEIFMMQPVVQVTMSLLIPNLPYASSQLFYDRYHWYLFRLNKQKVLNILQITHVLSILLFSPVLGPQLGGSVIIPGFVVLAEFVEPD